MKKFVMWGSYCPDVANRRAPFRQAHLDNLKQLHDAGHLLLIGPTQDLSRVFSIYQGESEAIVREMIESDPYWQNGIWTEYEVYEWVQVY